MKEIEKMDWCEKNRSSLNVIGRNARNTYENSFSDKAFILGLKNMLNPNCQSLSDDWKNYV